MNAKKFISALALVGASLALVAWVARGEQIENTMNDPILWQGFNICAGHRRNDNCRWCCLSYGFNKFVKWGQTARCTCAGFEPEVAVQHAHEVTGEKDYTSCAVFNARRRESNKCLTCCRQVGFLEGTFSGPYSDGQCCCMRSVGNQIWGS